MHYAKSTFAVIALLSSTACGRLESVSVAESHISTDANATYVNFGTVMADSNVKAVIHKPNQAGNNSAANANTTTNTGSGNGTTLEVPVTVTGNPGTGAINPNLNGSGNANVVADANTTATVTVAGNSNTTANSNDANSVGGTGAARYLVTNGNRIVWNDGSAWQGRGANIQDARGCGACVDTDLTESTQEVLRRIDNLVGNWNANFLRLTLESDTTPDILENPNYLQSIATIVAYVMQQPNVVLEVSLWIDPSFNSMGWPTTQTGQEWQQLVRTIGQYPRVMFGIANEPQYNSDGSLDANVWSAMNEVAQAIRDQETASGFMQHIVVAQGTGGWARYLQYYTTHPLTAGNGNNFAYEVHVYDAAGTFNDRFVTPSQSIPVIIGEFGPVDGTMTMDDCTTLMDTADSLGISYMGWTAHMRCPPNMLEDNSEGSCGIGMPLDPTAWGQLLIDHLAANAL